MKNKGLKILLFVLLVLCIIMAGALIGKEYIGDNIKEAANQNGVDVVKDTSNAGKAEDNAVDSTAEGKESTQSDAAKAEATEADKQQPQMSTIVITATGDCTLGNNHDLPDSSYSPGLVSSPLHFWMPTFITSRLIKGFQQFGKSSHGFLTNEAVMIGVETRTSAPVRILRDNETLQHVTINGLFPCGEGAGYAGGIVSAGIDGERCAEAVATYLGIEED